MAEKEKKPTKPNHFYIPEDSRYKNTLNELRVKYGLPPIDDPAADTLLVKGD